MGNVAGTCPCEEMGVRAGSSQSQAPYGREGSLVCAIRSWQFACGLRVRRQLEKSRQRPSRGPPISALRTTWPIGVRGNDRNPNGHAASRGSVPTMRWMPFPWHRLVAAQFPRATNELARRVGWNPFSIKPTRTPVSGPLRRPEGRPILGTVPGQRQGKHRVLVMHSRLPPGVAQTTCRPSRPVRQTDRNRSFRRTTIPAKRPRISWRCRCAPVIPFSRRNVRRTPLPWTAARRRRAAHRCKILLPRLHPSNPDFKPRGMSNHLRAQLSR